MMETHEYTNFDRHLELTEPEDPVFLPLLVAGCLLVIIVVVITTANKT